MKTQKIFDFDGFITNETAEARPFVEKYLGMFRKETGLSEDELNQLLEPITTATLSNPSLGWNVGGKIVAPATSSEYVFYTVLIQGLRTQAAQGNIPKEYISAILKVDDTKMQEMYLESYKASDTVFRDGAEEFLRKHIDANIVTNSSTAKVNEKLGKIGLGDGKIKLFGNAKKYVITEEIPGVPETLTHPEFPRQVYLWRSNYKKILDEICQGAPGTTCGDVWELDNSLPSVLGYRTITIDNAAFNGEIIGMSGYERRIVPTLKNSHVVKSLEEVDKILSEKYD
jgi:hypothetical protein